MRRAGCGLLGVVGTFLAGVLLILSAATGGETSTTLAAAAGATLTGNAPPFDDCAAPPGVMLGAEVAAAAAAGGIADGQLVTALAVARAESGWNPAAVSPPNTDGSIDRGLWQINSVHADLLARWDWRSPVDNARMAASVWSAAGGSWSPWTTYVSGSYRQWLPAARGAVAAYRAGGTPPPAGCTVATGPWARPLAGPYVLSSPFGMRLHPVLHIWELHDGQDLAAPCGTPVRAASAGVVVSAAYSTGYGDFLQLRHSGGVGTAYAHLADFTVTAGQRVWAGQVVAHIGLTGYTTGCHLHFMVRPDGETPADPVPWMRQHAAAL